MTSAARRSPRAFRRRSSGSLTHHRPQFGIDVVTVNNHTVAVAEEAADDTPFGTLLHFRKDIAVHAAACAAGRADVGPFRDPAARTCR